jgi:lipoic acid synthetase
VGVEIQQAVHHDMNAANPHPGGGDIQNFLVANAYPNREKDGGAAHYAACIRAIRELNPQTAVEALTPDFDGSEEAVATVVDSGLQVFAQNIETVERLTERVRDPRAGYQKTLDVLAYAKQRQPDILTKSSLMLGLGESEQEIQQTLQDLRTHGVDLLTLGQYLRPTKNHLPVERWVHPDEFTRWREKGLELGFVEVASGPLVRSSYRADRILEKNNLGLEPVDPNRISAVNLSK